MADKRIGERRGVDISTLPAAPDIYDDTLIPVEQEGEARKITGAQWSGYAKASVGEYTDAAKEYADAAKNSADAAADSAGKALTSQNAAKESETNAAKSEAAALASEQAAKASEEAAKKSENAAKASADASEASAQRSEKAAETAAQEAAEKAVADAEELLSGYVTDAETAKDAAATSASEAAASAAAAKASQDAALESQTAAAESEAAAGQSAVDAAASEAEATKQSAAAAKSATDADASAAAAKTAKTAAETAQSEAEAARDAAKSSETAAGKSAENAAGSATAASGSASAAAQSATSAEDSKTAAAASEKAASDSAAAALASQNAAKTSQDAAAGSATAAAGSASDAAKSAETAKQYSGNAPKPEPDTGTWWVWNAETGVYTDTGIKYIELLQHPYPSIEAMEADFGNRKEGELAIIASTVEEEDNSKLYIREKTEWTYLGDLSGVTGTSIQSFVLTSGDHKPGTTDTYTLTLTDKRTFTVTVYNGRDGEGKGDMLASVYDPDGRETDIFKYVDDGLAGKADETSVASRLADKADKTATETALAGKADKTATETALAGKADKAATETALGKKADLGEDGKVLASQLPALDYIPTAEKGAKSGVATLDDTGKVPSTQLPAMNYDPAGSASAVKTELQKAIDTKQDELTFDTAPTANSTNPVESKGVKSYVDSAIGTVNTTITNGLAGKVDTATYNSGLAGKQGTITASGILKGDGKGVITAATAADYVPPTRKVNNKALSADITLSAADVGARASTWVPTAADVKALPLTGGTMSGAIAMGNNKITGLATPTANTDAATKGYVDGNAIKINSFYREYKASAPTEGNLYILKFEPTFQKIGRLHVESLLTRFYSTGAFYGSAYVQKSGVNIWFYFETSTYINIYGAVIGDDLDKTSALSLTKLI